MAHFHEFRVARQRAERAYEDQEEMERQKRHAAVVSWLSGANTHLDQIDGVKERVNHLESGRWLPDRSQVKGWLDSRRADVDKLWIRGIPGAGKFSSLNAVVGGGLSLFMDLFGALSSGVVLTVSFE